MWRVLLLRAIRAGEIDLIVAGSVESMSRSPHVMSKAAGAFSHNQKLQDTTIGWRFINPLMRQLYDTDSMPEAAENIAAQFDSSRNDQDLFSFRSQQKPAHAQAAGLFSEEIVSLSLARRKQTPLIFDTD